MSLDGSSYISISVNLSVNDNCNTVVISHPFTIQNSPEFWDSAIRSADEVEAQIRITKKHNYEDLFAVVRCIDFSPNIPMPQPITMISSPYKWKGKENIEPESIGPSKLNDTKHLMMLQLSKRFVVDFDTTVSCLGQHITDVIHHIVYDSNIVIMSYLFKD
ncbi:hypothetical protein ZOSMA_40G00630 [Zostera marina]|uniref:Uncharacterized protein n=1 Tax=Zostera marina TaxID=29655 RepID=A0A0K9P5B8_ZOSMR|nr:hypothetical protein ZOSMA_40G00630 [Zostera marina]